MVSSYDLTLVVPCYNEAENIPLFLQCAADCFDEADVSLEIVFVNDGSQDGSDAILRALVAGADAAHPVQAITLSRNFGKEAALYAGLQAARGECIGFIDADLQQRPEDALRMYHLLLENPTCDCVAACQTNRKESLPVKLFKRAFYRTFNGVSDTISIPANVSDFRVFRRSVAEALLALPEGDRFSKGLFAWVGFNTMEVPYEPSERANGESKWSLRQLMSYAASGIFGFTTWPLKTAVWLGIAVAFAAGVYLLVVLGEYVLHGTNVPGFPTLACLILLFGGLQLTVLGVVGEYVARGYIEGKRRPIYIAKERLSSDVAASAQKAPSQPGTAAAIAFAKAMAETPPERNPQAQPHFIPFKKARRAHAAHQ